MVQPRRQAIGSPGGIEHHDRIGRGVTQQVHQHVEQRKPRLLKATGPPLVAEYARRMKQVVAVDDERHAKALLTGQREQHERTINKEPWTNEP